MKEAIYKYNKCKGNITVLPKAQSRQGWQYTPGGKLIVRSL